MEGRLTGRSVEELRQSCDTQVLGSGVRLTLDMADVSFAHAAGIDLLRNLRSRYVSLLNPSPFLAIQLEDHEGGGFTRAT